MQTGDELESSQHHLLLCRSPPTKYIPAYSYLFNALFVCLSAKKTFTGQLFFSAEKHAGN